MIILYLWSKFLGTKNIPPGILEFFTPPLMKLKLEQTLHIRSQFAKMKRLEDFVGLLNEVKAYKFGEKAHPFTVKQLNWYATPEEKLNGKKKYKQFEIPKKSGKPRIINAPVSGLMRIQECINIILQEIYEPHPAAMGFVPGKSIVDNAKMHVGQHFVFNIDLKDFFPSIDQARIWSRLQQPPFNIPKKFPGRIIADRIAGLCCHSINATERIIDKTRKFGYKTETPGEFLCHVLPQGAPTSPTLTNIVCEKLDQRLSGLAKRFYLRYSRYADDITFSSNHNVYAEDGEFRLELQRIIHGQNFRINDSKTRLQKRGYRQQVTGLTVNEQPNVSSRYIKQIRSWLHLWEKHGEAKAQVYFLKDYYNLNKGRGRRDKDPNIGNVLSGKLLFMKMVKGERNQAYQKLQVRLEKLLGNESFLKNIGGTVTIEELERFTNEPQVINLGQTEKALEILLKEGVNGFEKAMEIFLKK